MEEEELRCLAKQLKHEIETSGHASATILYNEESSQAEILDMMERFLGKENLRSVDLKMVYNEFDEDE